MKLILSKCRTNNFSEVSRILNENGYIQIGKSRTEPKNNLELFFFFESHEKKQIEWLSELLRFFNVGEADYKEHNIIDDTLYQYNAVIILKTPNNLYAHSLSQGFRVIEKFIDEEFGLKFAEKTIKNEHITLKNVSYIQKNKMKGITNYKKDQGEFPKASESYAYISGKPDFSFYGNSIDCGTGVSFPKNFDINSKEGFDQLSELLKNVDKALTLKENKSILPRKKRIAKSSQLSGSLDEEVIERIVNDVNEIGIALDVSKIHLVNNSINIYSENNHLEIYVSNHLKETKEELEPYDSSILEYIRKYNEKITSLTDLKIRVTNHEHHVIENRLLKEWIYCELEYNNMLYTLDSGFWGYFNDKFSELLKKQLEEINRVIEYNEEFNIYYSSGEGRLKGEGGYIEKLSENKNYIKLHQRNINYNGVPIEIADVYKKDTKELIAIKRGMDTSNSMYSFEQSILSLQLLRNITEFNVEEELLKYNDRKASTDEDKGKFPHIQKKNIEKILNSRISSVLWLQSTKKYVKMTEEKKFDFNQIGSILLKLKIVDWYSSILENNFTPKIYMGKDLQVNKKDQF